MNETLKLDAINRACAQVNLASGRAWNNFCALNDNPLHRQPEVLFLRLDLDTLRDVRDIIRENPNGNEDAIVLLECLRDTIFRNITNCIHAVTQAAARSADSLDEHDKTRIKHDVEGSLVKAAGTVRCALQAFDIKVGTEL